MYGRIRSLPRPHYIALGASESTEGNGDANVMPAKNIFSIERPAWESCMRSERPMLQRLFNISMKTIFGALALAVCFLVSPAAQAQSTSYSPIALTTPTVDTVDGNHVSVLTGKTHFVIPALKMGDVSFSPHTVSGAYFGINAVLDNNYGRIVNCESIDVTSQAGSSGTSDCAVAGTGPIGLQAIYGEQRATFTVVNGTYTPYNNDGSEFVDNGSTCTWIQRDGTQVVYDAYHVSGDPRCYSNDIKEVIHPDGRVDTYYYYGSLSTTYAQYSPILSVVSNSGYMLKYNYSGTPTAGGEASVTAINRAFQACDPTAVSCSLSGTWPTATLTFQAQTPSSSCTATNTGYSSNCQDWTFTIEDERQQKYVFELDGISRVIAYQPPRATEPLYYYTLCTMTSSTTLSNCWQYTTWPPSPSDVYGGAIEPLLFDWVQDVSSNGQTWNYNYNIQLGSPPYGWSTWEHSVTSPLGVGMQATGNSTPGEEQNFGPTDSITLYDGTIIHYERSLQNDILSTQTPAGVITTYAHDVRGNLVGATKTPISGSGQSPISESAVYPTTCANIVICNKPTSVTDWNGNTWTYTYDPTTGAMLTATGPAVDGQQPEIVYTYEQEHAWYLSSSGQMQEDPNGIWVRATKTVCMTSSSSTGCANASQETATSYDYGPSQGPNNLLVRGIAVASGGVTHRTCFGHDPQGDVIWKTSPNANPSSCSAY